MMAYEPARFEALRGTLRRDEPMRRHTSWRCGGSADRAYVPADLDDLSAFLRQLPAAEPVECVGLGSNLLVRDGGIRGTVVLMHAALSAIRFDGELLFAEAGVASPKVARFAATHDRVGAEFLAGIPGTVGGALAMNAGCYGSETWECVCRVLTVGRDGTLHERTPADYDIGYRSVRRKGREDLDGELFAVAWLAFARGDGARARERISALLRRRIATQPLELPNAGSVFRNPPGDHAARLIEGCGLKGFAIGAARVSEKHANFIVNPRGQARAADIEALIAHVRATVLVRTGVALESEVRIVGEGG
jgi:UDP-N-acetylmuramate dehydrogenase